MTDTLDTTEAGAEALYQQSHFYTVAGVTPDRYQMAKAVIEADRKALKDAGYSIIKHVPGLNCGDTEDSQGNCISLVDDDYAHLVGVPCNCWCHEETGPFPHTWNI